MTWDEQIIELFCHIDDFCQHFEPEWNRSLLSHKKRNRKKCMSLSEVMTILIHFHQAGYRNFKKYYTVFIQGIIKCFFPKSVSYGRFTELMKETIFPLFCLLQTKMGKSTGISFIDSTSLAVCHIKRSRSNKVFRGLARKGKTTTGWFFGFKLHIVINEEGEILAWHLTPGHTDDRGPVPILTRKILGLLFGDKGYISSKLFQNLYSRGLKLITRLRSNMKNKMMHLSEKILLKRRGLIESVNGQLKNIAQIEHTRHRSPWNFLSNLLSGLTAYSLQQQKPSLHLRDKERKLLKNMG